MTELGAEGLRGEALAVGFEAFGGAAVAGFLREHGWGGWVNIMYGWEGEEYDRYMDIELIVVYMQILYIILILNI